MTPITKMFEHDGGGEGYTPFLASMGCQIVLQVNERDYSGDSWLILGSADGYGSGDQEFGYLSFGWGSCSGCDALAQCGTVSDQMSLRRELKRKIKWCDDKQAMAVFLRDRDWKGLQENSYSEFHRFLAAARALFPGKESSE